MKFILWECDVCHLTDQTDYVPGEGPQPHGWETLLREQEGKPPEFHLCPACGSGTWEESRGEDEETIIR